MRATTVAVRALLLAGCAQASTFLEPKDDLITFPVANATKNTTESDVDKQVEAFVDKRYQANLKELGSYVSASGSQAAAAAEEAKLAEKQVHALDLQNKVFLAHAEDYTKQAEAKIAAAEASGADLDASLARAEELAKGVGKLSKVQAEKAVQDMFVREYKQLDSWREEVLTDHWENSQRAELQAFAPYEHAMGLADSRAKAYKAASQKLGAVSKGLADEAGQASLTASMKRISGDIDGADKLADVAKGLRAHSSELNLYAKQLGSESEELKKQAPEYLERGLVAGKRARYDANPGYMPPLDVKPDFDYVSTVA
eukprot:TRINITY_DN65471_c0_g1_i1.p1 TRINITY_DN65471_c0_g1~~TRINITY_DN65471_c0_g1_i1.p1  ORF type:complete len:314 (+),score=120.51 TRINITY_DN65471_c0_g1_i1:89-1030(+)